MDSEAGVGWWLPAMGDDQIALGKLPGHQPLEIVT